ncbi:MAG: alpha/beta fold hydrolase [Bdellovibrionales bacterium]|jgi:alpha-beta hydrolase superfamily lysophospholipase|nr:alpha/beta fold hydrolase [Bdellovibrionales bacterium]MBT3525841.1 alpha/beta fold hydrolase [Bdellovibrionales bacterium]MBT7670289.1 alpha/beta fold hydrolase [Bdellovibrionales bacterium]MBT7765668.1 alpha/beta fold hydrolase [Bdellovibrionales bacterium]
MIRSKTFSFRSYASRHSIYGKSFYQDLTSNNPPPIHLILFHDLGGYHGRFDQLISALFELAPNRFQISVIDFIGHGLSSGTRGHINSFRVLIEDLKAGIILATKNFTAGPPPVLLGYGLGGMVIVHMLKEYQLIAKEIDRVVLANALFRPRGKSLTKWGSNPALKHLKQFGKVKIPLRLQGEDILTHPEQIAEYNSDPLINHTLSFNLINEIISESSLTHCASYFMELPTLMLVSEEDELCDADASYWFAKTLNTKLVTYHSYTHLSHDLFNDQGRDKVLSDLYNWLVASDGAT